MAARRGAGGTGALLNMFLMFDRSTSMLTCSDGTEPVNDSCASVPTRWDLAAAGLQAFVQDPAAAELGVALRCFPHDVPEAGCTGGMLSVCDSNACSVPLVDLARLTADPAPTDTQEAALIDAIAVSVPVATDTSGGTPTSAALDGALQWAVNYQAAHSEETTVVVFVTDGEPNGCDEDFDNISQLAAYGLSVAGVRTFVVGLTDSNGTGVNADDMNQLAVAGGTEQAMFVSDGNDASAELLAALNAIRGRI